VPEMRGGIKWKERHLNNYMHNEVHGCGTRSHVVIKVIGFHGVGVVREVMPQ